MSSSENNLAAAFSSAARLRRLPVVKPPGDSDIPRFTAACKNADVDPTIAINLYAAEAAKTGASMSWAALHKWVNIHGREQAVRAGASTATRPEPGPYVQSLYALVTGIVRRSGRDLPVILQDPWTPIPGWFRYFLAKDKKAVAGYKEEYLEAMKDDEELKEYLEALNGR